MKQFMEFLLEGIKVPSKYSNLTKESCDLEKHWEEWSDSEQTEFLNYFGGLQGSRFGTKVGVVLIVGLILLMGVFVYTTYR